MVKKSGVCDFSRLAVTDWRLRRWRWWFLVLMTATRNNSILTDNHHLQQSARLSEKKKKVHFEVVVRSTFHDSKQKCYEQVSDQVSQTG